MTRMLTAAEYRTQVAGEMKESVLQERVLNMARTLGWRGYHTHDSRRSPAGFPDLVLVHVHQRRLIFAELKSTTGRIRTEQLQWLHDLAAADVETYIWRPADLLNDTIRRTLTRRPE